MKLKSLSENRMKTNTTSSEILLYQTEDGKSRIEVRLEHGSVWVTQHQMAELFQTDRSSISKHINNILQEFELIENETCAIFAQVQKEGMKNVSRKVKHYNLDMIISVGYRVRSHRGTQFRQWATEITLCPRNAHPAINCRSIDRDVPTGHKKQCKIYNANFEKTCFILHFALSVRVP